MKETNAISKLSVHGCINWATYNQNGKQQNEQYTKQQYNFVVVVFEKTGP